MTPHQRSTVLELLQSQLSQHEISRRTGIDRKTIRKFAQELATAEQTSAASPMATSSLDPPDQFTPPRPPAPDDSHPSIRPPSSVSACEPHRSWIEAQIRLSRNAMAIYQDLVDNHGFQSRYNSVKRFCHGLRSNEPHQFDRLEFLPGEEAQVDYGEGALTLIPGGTRYRKPRLFVMTLRFSRRSFRCVVWKSSSEVWARLHEEAFRYFGGCPQYVVLDNLKEGVIKPNIYEPELNRVYALMLSHYSVVADPARIRDPNRKGTVENAIQHTQSTALKGRRFESIEAQNSFLAHWEEKWASLRVHGRAKRQVEAMFQEERPYLKILPIEGFRYFTEGQRTVQDDTTVQVDHAWYAARPALIGSIVLVRCYAHEIEIRNLSTLVLIRRHSRATRRGAVNLPDAERVFNPTRQTRQLLARAEAIGLKTHELCQQLFDHRGREGQKSMWGIVGLSARYPAWLLEQACATALTRQSLSYKAVHTIADQLLAHIVANLDPQQIELPLGNSALTQEHELIRNINEYADFFKHSTSRSEQNDTDLSKELPHE